MITSCHGHKAVQAVDSFKTNLKNNFISLPQNFSEASKGVKGFGPIYSNG